MNSDLSDVLKYSDEVAAAIASGSPIVALESTIISHGLPRPTNLEVARPLLSSMASMHRAGVDNYFMYGPRIRKLTPKECLRLMGFSDKFKIVVSDTQAYKQAGNSMVVDVLMHLFDSIIKSMKWK